MKSLAVLIIISLNVTLIKSQNYLKNQGYYYPIYEDNNNFSLFEAIQNIYLNNEKPSYISVCPKFKSIDRRYPLEESAGVNGFLFDAAVNQNFTLLRGRDASSYFKRLSQLSFYFGYHLRMTKDSSKPLLPSNDLFGLEYRLTLWNNETNWIFKKINYSKLDTSKSIELEEWNNRETDIKLKVFYFSLLASHYSNGQPPGFYKTNTNFQHDYLNGDFSTNFLRLMFYFNEFKYYHKRKNSKDENSPTTIDPRRHLITVGIGYQKDLSISNTLSFSPEQEKSYGKNRLLGMLKFDLNNFYVWSFKYKPKGPFFDGAYKIKEYLSLSIRFEPTLILGNLEHYYDSPNYVNNTLKKKYRFAMDSYIEITLLRLRTMGLIIHHFWGRDYLNIRYDDIISTTQIGLTFKFTKKTPLRFRSGESGHYNKKK